MLKRIKTTEAFLFVLVMSCSILVSCATLSKTQDNETQSFIFTIKEDKEFGSALIEASNESFAATGIEFGDSVNVKFSSGFRIDDIPYYSGYYDRVNKPAVVNYSGVYLCVAYCSGNSMWKAAGCKDGDTVEITINEKGKYINTEEALHSVYNDDRNTYKSDELFCNFRAIAGGPIKENKFYRGATPLDNQRKRAQIADKLLEKYGIKYVLDLADTDEKIAGYINKEDFKSEYTKGLYSNRKLDPLGLSASYRSEEFAKKIVAGLKRMMDQNGPYYIHCTEGKDRTGFVCLLLEALVGASYEELEKDYMTTYDSYYGINKESSPKQYDAIKSVKFDDMVWWLEDVPDNTDLTEKDLSVGAKNYLLRAGMKESDINRLILFLKY